MDGSETLEKPLAAALNHLYIQKGHIGQSLVALSSSHRFRSKYVTAVLYKPVKKKGILNVQKIGFRLAPCSSLLCDSMELGGTSE
ncbi:hypothetical protein U1Q18_024299 [Sarracenia purpurea var. burkii]